MLTVIGRAAAQRLAARAAPLVVSRYFFVARVVARRAFSTTRWARLPAQAAASTATKKPKASATKKETTPAAKKVAAKKPAAKKPAAKKPAAKKPAAKKKKKVTKKVKPKRVKTPEELLKLKIRELKTKALLKQEPQPNGRSAWQAYVNERSDEFSKTGDRAVFGALMKSCGNGWRNLSSYEVQRYEEIAKEQRLKTEAAYKAWVESYDPLAIRNANLARRHLRRITKNPRIPKTIEDHRAPASCTTAFMMFCKEQWATGRFAKVEHAKVAAPQLAKEWREMSDSKKQSYRDLADDDSARYHREAEQTYGQGFGRPKRQVE
ncbi:High mobility group protein DSP1 [Colletotrichum sidae]|uniref:High mobility group protein DSP1 n=1 Tax=Colletotrichum sidae TaxID=1347389 RepID=A0A4R8T9K7_9PEZI|nr:High mobility group protein DSP1 [Colletotrichum sidae]